MTLLSAIVVLFLVLDPLGNIPLFMTVLGTIDERRRLKVILRESLIAFLSLFIFLCFGRSLLQIMQLSETSVGIAGGIILFLIAVRMLFPTDEGVFGGFPEGEPFIVPLAIPLICGPSAIATVILFSSRYPDSLLKWIVALTVTIAISTVVLMLGASITRTLGNRGVIALERLSGLILTTVAVEMFLNGLREFISKC